MSEENLEVVRRLYAAWGQRPDLALRFLADDFEYVNPDYAVHPGTRHGKDGWLAAAANLSESFEQWAHEPGEMIPAEEKVVVIATFRARGRGSTMDLEKYEPHVWTLRGDRVTRFQWFNEREEALRAAGLAE